MTTTNTYVEILEALAGAPCSVCLGFKVSLTDASESCTACNSTGLSSLTEPLRIECVSGYHLGFPRKQHETCPGWTVATESQAVDALGRILDYAFKQGWDYTELWHREKNYDTNPVEEFYRALAEGMDIG